MKLIKTKTALTESKEAMPISFITDFISRDWSEVGILQDQIKGLKHDFSGTAKVEESLQGIIDAYLVGIGQMEKFLSDKKNIRAVKVDDTNDKKIEESIKIAKTTKPLVIEPASEPAEPFTAPDPEPFTEPDPEPFTEPVPDDNEVEATARALMAQDQDNSEMSSTPVKKEVPDAEFDYYVDFSDPEGEAPTDDDIYSDTYPENN